MADTSIPSLSINQEKSISLSVPSSDATPSLNAITFSPNIYNITDVPGLATPIVPTSFGLGWWMYVNSQ